MTKEQFKRLEDIFLKEFDASIILSFKKDGGFLMHYHGKAVDLSYLIWKLKTDNEDMPEIIREGLAVPNQDAMTNLLDMITGFVTAMEEDNKKQPEKKTGRRYRKPKD